MRQTLARSGNAVGFYVALGGTVLLVIVGVFGPRSRRS
jgi:hypothetical protein